MNYKKALEAFNATEEYQMQMKYLCELLDIQKDDVVMDYGAGLGNTIEYIKKHYNPKHVWGFDVEMFVPGADWYREEVPEGWINKLYFMHSFAHIRDISVIQRLRLANNATVVVITPNNLYIEEMGLNKPGYVDPTVIKHYSPSELKTAFEMYGYTVEEVGEFGRTGKNHKERAYLKARFSQK